MNPLSLSDSLNLNLSPSLPSLCYLMYYPCYVKFKKQEVKSLCLYLSWFVLMDVLMEFPIMFNAEYINENYNRHPLLS